MSKRILVTGGLGFIGSHLCKRLLEDGHQVVCLDNLSTGQIDLLDTLTGYSNFRFMNWDIVNPIPIEESLDEIYNLACPASPIHYQSDPIKTTQTSVLGILNVLNLAQKNRCRILQASTSEVYGDPTEHPQREDYCGRVNIIGIRSCYDVGKRCAESLCMDYYRQYGTKVKIVRIFNTYGPNMSKEDGRVISNFIVQALRNEDITIYGTGEQTRSFQYIDDLIEGMLRMMQTADDLTGPINLGNPHEITIRQLAQEIIRLTSSQSALSYCTLPSDDPCRRCPDITKARKNLGNWSPKVDLMEGLQATIAYFKRVCCYETV